MIILILFAFLAGIVTILSPCILPILPIVLATSVGGRGKDTGRPLGIITGFVASFTFFTLFLSLLVKLLGIPADALRGLSIVIITIFGLSLLVPRLQSFLEGLFSRLANNLPSTVGKTGLPTQVGFWGGVAIGFSLGLLWTPCVGPILASVIALAVTGTVTLDTFIITLTYALGTAIPMFLVIRGGQNILTRPWLLRHTRAIQQWFGVLMIATALALMVNADRAFQTYILTKFPQYGTGLTELENNSLVQKELQSVSSVPDTGTPAPELVAGGEWFNSKPLKLSDLRGKVVLLDFWTYTCINCQRTIPYLKSWYAKYKDQGLVIIGVHSPEFAFEHDAKNVAQAIKDFGITYPVMQDNDFATWTAYHNQYWPAEYAIDKDGRVRHTHFGEGDYDSSEKVIQDLLKETGAVVTATIGNPDTKIYARTPETYLGARRSQGESYLSYTGNWTQSEEYTSPAAGSTLTLDFDAKSVYLVMRNTGKPATVNVFLDGKLTGQVTVNEDKLYTLVDLPSPGAHKLRLEFVDDNAELFAFTFG